MTSLIPTTLQDPLASTETTYSHLQFSLNGVLKTNYSNLAICYGRSQIGPHHVWGRVILGVWAQRSLLQVISRSSPVSRHKDTA
jgi:hypothetical protein